MGGYRCIQPQYCFVWRTNTVLCSWSFAPPWLCLLRCPCQELGVDHSTVPAKPLKVMQLCWQDCCLPGQSCLFGDTTLAEPSYTRSTSQFAETSALLESCKNGPAPVLLGNKISLPKPPPLWADLKQLLLIMWCFSSYQKCSFKHIPAYFNEHPSSNCFKCMVSSNEIFTWILNVPRSSCFGRIILKAFTC